MFDNAHRSIQLSFQGLGIVERSKRTVEDVVPVIRDERLSFTRRSDRNAGADGFDPPRGRTPTERHNFYCDGASGPEAIYELGLVDHDNQLPAGPGDDLFPQQSSASPLQKVEAADLDLIRPVDRDVNTGMLCQS